jgi:hypothetical protein
VGKGRARLKGCIRTGEQFFTLFRPVVDSSRNREEAEVENVEKCGGFRYNFSSSEP